MKQLIIQKKNQCKYLNNSIRLHGEQNFTVELLESCSIDELNDKETIFIEIYNTLYPNGYNLTKGGKRFYTHQVTNNADLAEYKKRGRPFGYIHNIDTKKKIKERLEIACNNENKRNKMRNVMTSYYDKKKIDILKSYKLDDNIEMYIKPVYKKNTNNIHNYMIRIDNKAFGIYDNVSTLEDKYEHLKKILIIAKEQSNNC